MADQLFSGHTKFGALGGIITIFLVNITSGDILRTIILTAVGAIVSVTISFLLKYGFERWRNK